jgi:hypothetical protein
MSRSGHQQIGPVTLEDLAPHIGNAFQKKGGGLGRILDGDNT